MRRRLGPLLALLLALLLLVGLWDRFSTNRVQGALVIFETQGDVRLSDVVGEREALHGMTLGPDDRIQTGADSRAVLRLGEETRIRLGPTSSIQVKAASEEGVQIELEGGALQATVRPDSGSLRLSSGDREALLTDADVEMGVLPGSMLVMEVTRGDAMLGGIPGASALQAGQRLVVSEGYAPEVGPISEEMVLAVQWPESRRTREESIHVQGQTAPGARVTLVGSSGTVEVRADRMGYFDAQVTLFEGQNPLRVEAVDLLGNAVEVKGLLERDQSGPTFRGGVEYPD